MSADRSPDALSRRARGLGAVAQTVLPAIGRRLARAFRDPETAQTHALRRVIAETGASRRGRRLGVGRVRTLAELQRAAPLVTYDDLADDLARAADGDRAVLTRTPILRFERSGGSSGAQKLLPQTAPFLADMNRALLPWLASLYARPGVADGPGYWSISPIGAKAGATEGGLSVGAVDDTSYFPSALRPLLRRFLAVPSAVGALSTVEVCRYVTLRLLLEREDLAFVSVWSPTFLTLLMEHLDGARARLAADLADGVCRPDGATDEDRRCLATLRFRRSRARAAALLAGVPASTLWPRVALLSMWCDADSARFVSDARRFFPDAPVEPKGLLATEGVVSVPLDVGPPVAAATSHVIELIDEDDPHGRPLLLHDLAARLAAHRDASFDAGLAAKTYEVVLSTTAGLLRYRLGDRVRVDGFFGRTPRLRFVGRAGNVSDLVGEKLAAGFVARCLEAATRRSTLGTVRFATLAPVEEGRPHYRVFLDADGTDEACLAFGSAVDHALAEGHAYRYARDLGQLGPVRVTRVPGALRRYEEACVAAGQRAGDIKVDALLRRGPWRERFVGRAIDGRETSHEDDPR